MENANVNGNFSAYDFYDHVPLSNCLGNTTAIPTYSPLVSSILVILTSLFCIVTLIGNIAVIIVICNGSVRRSHQQRKSQQHIYLVSLAVADASLAILVVPFSLANELLGKWPFGDVYCRIYLSVDILLCTASIWSICCIGFDRYISVRFPTAFQQYRTVPRILCFTLSIWIFSAGVSVLPFLGESTTIHGDDHCFINDVTWYIVLSSSLSFLIPTCFIIPLYTCIYVVGIKVGSRFRTRYTTSYEAKSPTGTSKQPTYKSDQVPTSDASRAAKLNQRRSTKRYKIEAGKITPILRRSQSVKLGGKADQIHHKRLSNYEENKKENPLLPVVSYSLLPKDGKNNAARTASQGKIENESLLTVPSAYDVTSDHKPRQSRSRSVFQNNGIIFEEDETIDRQGTNIFWGCFRKLGLVKNDDSSDDVRDWRSTVSVETNSNRLHSVASIGSIFKHIRSKRESTTSLHSNHGRAKRERRFTYIIVIVCGCYMLCWTPFFVSYLVYSICRQDCCIDLYMFKSFFWLGYLNSGINPVLYTIFNKDFRRAFKKLFRMKTNRM